LRTTCLRVRRFAILHHPSIEPFLDQPQDAGIVDAMLYEPDQPTLVEVAVAFKWIRIVFRCWQDGVA
jgi:hypothetical protein